MTRKMHVKMAALICCGGVVLQIGGCLPALLQIAAQQIGSTLLSNLLSGVLGNTPA